MPSAGGREFGGGIGWRILINNIAWTLRHFPLFGVVGDAVVTRAEIAGLMAELLHVDAPPAGQTRLTAWAVENAARLGRRYASEPARRQDRQCDYEGFAG